VHSHAGRDDVQMANQVPPKPSPDAPDQAVVKPRKDPPETKSAYITGVFGVLSALVAGVLALAGGYWLGHAHSNTGNTVPSATSVTATGLHFNPLGNTQVPRCAKYSGTGKKPAGYELLIFDRGVGPGGQLPDNTWYFYDGVASWTGDVWTTPKLETGDIHVLITAVLVQAGTAAYLDSIVLRHQDNSPANDDIWKSSQLPPGQAVDPPLLVDPDLSDTQSCKQAQG
jgi:hypothetical protein